MDFSISAIHDLEKHFQNLSKDVSGKLKCENLKDVTRELLNNKSVTKDILTDIVQVWGCLLRRVDNCYGLRQ